MYQNMATPDDDGYIKCTKCNERLPGTIEYFHRHRNGFKAKCKDCRGDSGYGIHNPRESLESKEGQLYCSKCLNQYPADRRYFYVNNNQSSGFSCRCKKCHQSPVDEFGVKKKNFHRDDGKWLCYKCDTVYERTAENFYRDSGREDGFKPYCKGCTDLMKFNRDASGEIGSNEWQKTLEKWDYECAYCGGNTDIGKDHVVPVSKDGENNVINVVPACQSCNSSKNTRNVIEWYREQPFYDKKRELEIMNARLFEF